MAGVLRLFRIVLLRHTHAPTPRQSTKRHSKLRAFMIVAGAPSRNRFGRFPW